jgi:hypothetical protein
MLSVRAGTTNASLIHHMGQFIILSSLYSMIWFTPEWSKEKDGGHFETSLFSALDGTEH